jgi:predicted ATPase
LGFQGRLRRPLHSRQSTTFSYTSEKNGEHFWDAELQRLLGELHRRSDGHDGGKAESAFQRALQIARETKARSLELRAATSLARLMQQRDRRAEARDLLRPVYDWFTEGAARRT